jgi:integrase/recombinase XerD
MPVAKKRELSANTEKTYGEYQRGFRTWLNGRKPTLKLGEAYLEYLRDKGAARNTIGVAGRALRRFFNLEVAVPSIEMMEPHYLSVEQVRQIIDAAPTPLERTVMTLMFSSACRISEILNLTKDDLELDKGVATVTRKGGRRERVALGVQGTEALRSWLKERHSKSRRVFMDFNYNQLRYRINKIARNTGIHFTAHWLRHSRVRHLRDSGVDWPDISEVCGHTRVETTMKIYGRRRAEERSKLLKEF